MAHLLAKNIGFLGVSQAANYLLPLVTIPYITRVVGPKNYGLIEFATVAMLYFSALVIYGFSYTATRKIAEQAQRPKRVASLFYTVLYTRILLFAISALLFVALLLLVPQMAERSTVMLFAFPVVLGWALYPDYLFQGLQKLKVVALANLAIKLLAAGLIFAFLHQPEHYYLVVGINSVAQIIVALATLYYAFRTEELPYRAPSWRLMFMHLSSGWYIFLSHFFTRIYTFGSIIFLGFLLHEVELGLFAAAMKLVIVGQSFLFLPLGGALFPHFSALSRSNFSRYLRERKKYLLALLLISAFAAAVIMLFPHFFVLLVFGESYLSVAPFLRAMAPILVLTAVSHFSLKQGLIVLRQDKINLYLVVGVGLASLLLNAVLIHYYALWGATVAKIATEALLALGASFYFYRSIRRRFAAEQA